MFGDVIVKKSKIHGLGVFASRDFRKGEVVLKWDLTEKVSSEKLAKLSPEERKHMIFLEGNCYVLKPPEGLLNHSCYPNTSSQDSCDVAIRNIKKGEEITTDYSKGDSPGQGFKCNCGSKNCRKKISRS